MKKSLFEKQTYTTTLHLTFHVKPHCVNYRKIAFTLAEVFSPRCVNCRKFAFTLAEVLITLGIIGVVSAITIPTLIAKHQKIQTATKLKQTYSLMMQALRNAENDYGPVADWRGVDSKTFCDQYITPYYKIVKEISPAETPENYYPICHKSKNKCDAYGGFKNSTKIVIANGAILIPAPLSVNGYNNSTMIVDINGMKGPNEYSRDFFIFNLDYKKGIVPYGMGLIAGQEDEEREITRDELMNKSDSRRCKTDGLYCAGVIMLDGWQIAPDYPW